MHRILNLIFFAFKLKLLLLVKCMMYGFGDDENPYAESVELLEDLVIQYIQTMVIYVYFYK